MEQNDRAFGELRSLMNQDILGVSDRERVWRLIAQAHVRGSAEVVVQWNDYLRSFPKHWQQPLMTFDQLEALERAVEWAPFAQFALSPSRESLEIEERARLAGAAALEHVHTFELHHYPLYNSEITKLFDSAPFAQLQEVTIRDCSSDEALLDELLKVPCFPQLRALTLSHCRIRPAGCARLAQAKGGRGLRHLSLFANMAGDQGLRALCGRDAVLCELRSLELFGNHITDAGLKALDHPGVMPHLESLGLGHNKFNAAGLKRLASMAGHRSLRSLDLQGSDLGNRRLESFFSAFSTAHLERLDLHGNTIGQGGAKALAGCRALCSLKTLKLGHNRLNDQGVTELTHTATLSGLHDLDVCANEFGPKGLKAILGHALASGLERLNAGGNRLGQAGADELASSTLAMLRHLDLGRSGIGDAGAQALSRAPFFGNLVSLKLVESDLSVSGLDDLLRHAERLETLDLSYNALGDEAIGVLLDSPHVGKLRELNLWNTKIGKDGLRQLIDSSTMERLQRLNLGYNAFDPKDHEVQEWAIQWREQKPWLQIYLKGKSSLS